LFDMGACCHGRQPDNEANLAARSRVTRDANSEKRRNPAPNAGASRDSDAVSPALSIKIPDALLPTDGRFGCGPSKVRPEAVAALAAAAPSYLGTSHRQPTVQYMVAALRNGLQELFALPDGYEVMLGNGGSSLFWDAACFSLILKQS